MRTFIIAALTFIIGLGFGGGIALYGQRWLLAELQLAPHPSPTVEPLKPLLAYTVPNLRRAVVAPAPITLVTEDELRDPRYRIFTYTSKPLGRTMSGVVNLPTAITASTSAIVMLRGWVPPNQYAPGVGTKNVAAALAKAGFITIAPDFFGYGESEPEPADEWQARFEKPQVVQALLAGLRTDGVKLPDGTQHRPPKIGLWGHSNGGQITLSTLAITQEALPTVLWAPVSAPFPYSILYYSDEEADEGQQTRKWISLFEKNYDARQFSFTNYLDGLRGPLQIHQGTNDDAVLKWWSDEFVQKIEKENQRRAKLVSAVRADATGVSQLAAAAEATEAVGIAHPPIASPVAESQPIQYDYFLYPGADHNLRPDWETALQRTIEFFQKTLQ